MDMKKSGISQYFVKMAYGFKSRLIDGQIGQIFVATLVARGQIYLTIDMCAPFDNAREAVKDVASSMEDELPHPYQMNPPFWLNLLP